VIEQQLLDAFVAVLACRVDRGEPAALAEVRIGAMLEGELHELVRTDSSFPSAAAAA
jgi:hypothetical protein